MSYEVASIIIESLIGIRSVRKYKRNLTFVICCFKTIIHAKMAQKTIV